MGGAAWFRREATPEPMTGDTWMLTPRWLRRLGDELHAVAHPFLARHLSSTRSEGVRAAIDAFLDAYPRRPVGDNRGGSGFHNCFWLYLVASCMEPDLIIESGVWKGQTAWLFRRACPRATILCFDPNLARLAYRDASIRYYEHDWETFRFGSVDATRSLCFFDDHVNQARRVREAYDRGFRTLLFDDDPPVHKLFSFGYPGTPTTAMLVDSELRSGDVVEWVWRGEPRRYISEPDRLGARALITLHELFPDVSSISQFEGYTFLTWVGLKP